MRYLLIALLSLIPFVASAQPYQVVNSCGSVSNAGAVGSGMGGYIDSTGHICTNAAGADLTGANASGANVTATGGVTPISEANRAAWVANIADQGAKCDGTTTDSTAFALAVATGTKSVVLPVTGSGCVTTTEIVPQSGQTFAGAGGGVPWIKVTSPASRAFNLTGLNNVVLSGLKLDGTSAASGQDFVRFLNTTHSKLINSQIINAPSTLGCVLLAQTTVDTEIAGNYFAGCASTDILANNAGVTQTKVRHNTLDPSIGFGIRFMAGARNFSITDNIINQYNASTTTYGIEPIAVSLGSGDCSIVGNDLSNSGDNQISIVGDHCSIVGNKLHNGTKSGLYIWGFENSAIGNIIWDNNTTNAGWPCIGVATFYGGTGQNNVAKGNVCDDDQAVPTQLGIAVNSGLLPVWSAGATITATEYVSYGFNIYVSSGAGTAGATPPTCTSGTCSDGTITWTYQGTYLTQVGTVLNDLRDNKVVRFAGGSAYSGMPLQNSRALNRNPDFLVSQVYLDNSSPTTVNFGSLVIDGWRTVTTASTKFTYQRVATSLPNYQYHWAITSLSATTPAATDAYQVINRIEGIDIAQLQWGTVNAMPLTLDMCLNTTGITGQIPVVLDNTVDTAYVTSFNVTATGAWQCFSTTIPGPTIGSWGTVSNSIALRLGVGLGAGSSKTTSTVNTWATAAFGMVGPTGMAQLLSTNAAVIRLAAVHLYPAGSQYLARSYAEELTLAQRYFFSTFSQRGAPGNSAGVASAYCVVSPIALSIASGFLKTPVTMFGTSPTITTYNPSASNANWRDVTAGADNTVTVDPASAKGQTGVLLQSASVTNAGDALCIHATIDSGT